MLDQDQLKEGELICNKCEGRGTIASSFPTIENVASVCQKCQGHGKVDWIENITGKKPEFSFSSSGFSSSSDFAQPFVNDVSDQLAEQVDRSIIRKIQEKFEDSYTFFKNKLV